MVCFCLQSFYTANLFILNCFNIFDPTAPNNASAMRPMPSVASSSSAIDSISGPAASINNASSTEIVPSTETMLGPNTTGAAPYSTAYNRYGANNTNPMNPYGGAQLPGQISNLNGYGSYGSGGYMNNNRYGVNEFVDASLLVVN